METVNIDEAQTRLSQLVDRAAGGEDVVLSRDGEAIVRITRLSRPKRKIQYGALKGEFTVPDDFDAPLPDEVLDAFEGR